MLGKENYHFLDMDIGGRFIEIVQQSVEEV